jgi:hypothetical protein
LFRFAKSISQIQAALKAYYDENDPLVRFTTVIQQVCLALWLFYDHIIWAGEPFLFFLFCCCFFFAHASFVDAQEKSVWLMSNWLLTTRNPMRSG